MLKKSRQQDYFHLLTPYCSCLEYQYHGRDSFLIINQRSIETLSNTGLLMKCPINKQVLLIAFVFLLQNIKKSYTDLGT